VRWVNSNDPILELTIETYYKEIDQYCKLTDRKTGLTETIGPIDLISDGKYAFRKAEKRLRYKVAQWYDENQ
jgi:hypothetical protein